MAPWLPDLARPPLSTLLAAVLANHSACHWLPSCDAQEISQRLPYFLSFPGGSAGKESACNAGDPSLIPGLERSPGEGNGYSLQYSCLKNSMDRGTWQGCPWGHKESDRTKRLTLSFLIVALQCYASFYCTAKQVSHTYTDIPCFLAFLSV